MSSEKGKQMTELCERASYMFHGGWYAVKLAESGLVKRQTGPALPLLFVLSNIIVTVVGIVKKAVEMTDSFRTRGKATDETIAAFQE